MRLTIKLIMFVAALAAAELGVARAEASTITWHWAGPVTGQHGDTLGGPSINTVVPLGTTVDVFVSFDSAFPTYPNPIIPCLLGTASVSLQVLGRTYTGRGYVWDEAYGFGPGICVPGFDVAEIVVPGWGYGGPALPDGWVPSGYYGYLPGLWWDGDFTMVQPTSISSQFPSFYRPMESTSQRLIADLRPIPVPVPVPEPATWLLLSTGLSAAAWCRRHQKGR